MDLYRVFVCFCPEDEPLALSISNSSVMDLSCLHLPLPSPNSVFCFKSRRKFLKLLRCHAGDSVRPRKTRDLKLAANFWTSRIENLRKPPNREEDTSEWGSEIFSEAGLQLHRLFDYFSPRDLRMQLEIVCCFSNASLNMLDCKLPDNLSSALLRAVEFQEGRVLFVLPSASSSSLPSSWLRDFNALLFTVDSVSNCQLEEKLETAPIWKGGLRFCSDQIRSRLPGLQIFASKDEEEAKLSAVSLAPARWIDVIRPIDCGDLRPLLPSGRRLSLCLQSSSCSDAVACLRFIRSSAGFFCRLPLYSASTDFSGGRRAEEEDFIPPSERWASQLLSDLRSDESPSSLPPPSICLSILLLPSASFAASQINPLLLPCDVILLRQSWELPLPFLLKATATSKEAVKDEMSEEDKEALHKALDEVCEGAPSESTQGMPSDATSEKAMETSEASRELASLLKSHVMSRRCGDRRSGGLRPELTAPLLQRQCSEKSEGLSRKDSDGADHLIEQLLRAFQSDGAPAASPLQIVKPQHRSIVDSVEDPSQLHWPHAANVFYHGIYYNRGPWCEKRAERLSKLQTAAIPQETMCTVTRFGCRGNVASSRPLVPAKDARSKRKESSSQEKPSSEPQLSRSQRHEEKLRAVVCEVLAEEGIQPADQRFAALSFNLFAATKTVIKLQKLPTSRNLRQKMEEAAKLQFQVIKQLING